METHNYKVSVTWMNDKIGWAEAPGVREPVKFSAPPEFGGEAGLWSSELLLVFAAGSCFLSTLLAVAERNNLTLVGYQAEAEAHLERVPGKGYRFTEVVIRPRVTLEKESDIPLAERLLEKAEHACIVANALSVPVRVQARLEVIAPAPLG
ncbi:MAG: OsmC family protein [Acidobacteria bacterium]|nr:OsmC family protein [Acidobacteriota bacterium]